MLWSWMWRYPWQFMTTLVVVLVPFHRPRTIVVVNAFLDCEGGPATFRHVAYGEGVCHLFGPGESAYLCCRLCNQVNPNSIASEYLPPGGKDPFLGSSHNDALCCCYYGGFVFEGRGGNSSVYYMEREL